MKELKEKARDLLKNKDVQVVIGYGDGTGGKPRAIFIRDPKDAERLIFDEKCEQNLAVYLMKHEVKKLGRPAIVATIPVVRSIIQLAAENQIAEGSIVILAVTPDGKLTEIKTLRDAETFVSSNPPHTRPEDLEKLERIEKMTVEERWTYWLDELSRCFKCYACRSSCPMCYCERCTIECNQPQWVSPASHHLGNVEWHIIRAMHIAGRCVNCGECARACPLDIPINLLTLKVSEDIRKNFGLTAGMSATLEYALSTFKTDDKEEFIR